MYKLAATSWSLLGPFVVPSERANAVPGRTMNYGPRGVEPMFGRRSLAAAMAAIVVLAAAGTESHAATAKSYSSCSALNRVYPHGVGHKGARDQTRSGTNPVTNFKVSNTLYAYNDGGSARHPGEHDLDRDNDGVACERR
jgi:hypothetical protein